MTKTSYSGLKDKRILVVEDVELNQYLARHIMESWGCVVEVVENGSIALQRINDTDFDLVLMDIQMPVMDGIEATRKIREMSDQVKATIPIVALTANSMKSECDTYIRIGMNDWLGKPFQEPALYETVSKNIRKERVVSTQIANAIEEKQHVKESRPKLYDTSMVEALSGGDKSFVERMLRLFLDTVPVTLKDLQTSAEAGEWLALSKHAHKLKSTIDSMNIASLKQTIREIEVGGKTNAEPELLRTKTGVVLKVMEYVIAEVKEREV